MSKQLRILLNDLGFGMGDLARAIGYPQGALRSFREGRLAEGDPTSADAIGEALADFLSICRRLQTAGSAEPASLLTCRVVEGYTATGLDLLHAGCEVALFDLAAGRPAEQVLSHYVPDWRTRYWTDYETFLAPDGCLSIRRKEGSA